MDPNQRNPANVGSGLAPGTYALAGQNQGFDFQYGHIGGYQQPHGKPSNVQNIMSGTVNTLVQSYAAGAQNQGTVLTNVQASLPLNNYVPASSASSALPSMGTFVASFQQQNPNIGLSQVFKGNMDTWMGQGQSVNSLPSFGHFLMHQQSSPHQQQQSQIPTQLFPGNQGQNRYPSTFSVNSQVVPNTTDLIGGQSAGNCGNVNPNFSANFHSLSCANLVQGNSATFSPIQGHGASLVTNYPNQFPTAVYNTTTNQIASGPQIVASCNQVTNTTSSVITMTSTGLSAPVTAQVHTCTSVSSTIVPSVLVTSNNVAGNWRVCDGQDANQASSVGCEIKRDITLDVKSVSHSECGQAGGKENSNIPFVVIVPFGWRRVHTDDSIVYYSPSNTKLSSYDEIIQYLAMDGTCKCGLECPVMVSKVFNFDTEVISKQWSLDMNKTEDLTKLCNHKRKIVAMASFQSTKSVGLVPDPAVHQTVCTNTSSSSASSSVKTKKETKSKKKKSKNNYQTTAYDGLLVSQLIAQREKMKSSQTCSSENASHLVSGSQQVITEQQVSAAGHCGVSGQGTPDGQSLVSIHQNVSGHSSTTGQPETESHNACSSGQMLQRLQCDLSTANSKEVLLSPGCNSQHGQNTPLMSPTGSDLDSLKSEVKAAGDDLGPISSGKQIKLDFSKELVKPPNELARAPSQPLVSPTSPAVNRPQSQPLSSPNHLGQFQQNPLTVQTVFPPEHMKDQLFVQQSPHGQMRSSPHFTFPHNPGSAHTSYSMGMPIGNSPVNMQHSHGMIMAGMQHQGNYPMYQFPNASVAGYMGPPIDQRIMTGQYHVGSVHGANNPRPSYSMNLQHGMYHMPNPVLSGMIDASSWTEQKKPRAKKPRAKKEKKKVNNVFESDTPPPNVDVSQLKDQGRGPIPKVKTSAATPTTTTSSLSFMDNPTAFLAEQTALISNSLTSTLSSPTHSSTGGNVSESSNLAKSSEESKSDTVDGDVNAPCTTTSLKSSPNVVVHSSSISKIGNKAQTSPSSSTVSPSLAAAVGAVISKATSSTSADAVLNLTSSPLPGADSHMTPTLTNTNMNIFTEDRCESLSPDDTCGECPPLTETITPSSVVHHTPAKNDEEHGSTCDSKTFTVEKNKLTSGNALHVENSLTQTHPDIKQNIGPPSSIAQIQDKAGFVGARNFGNFHTLQQMLGHHNSNQFPASNLLSAAARAQMAQQQQQQNVSDVFNVPQSTVTGIHHLSQPAVSSIQVTQQPVSNIHVTQKGLSNIQPPHSNIQQQVSTILETQTNISLSQTATSNISKIHTPSSSTPKQAASVSVTQISGTQVPPTLSGPSNVNNTSAPSSVLCTKLDEPKMSDVSSKQSVASVSSSKAELKCLQNGQITAAVKTPDSVSITAVTVPLPSAKIQCQPLNGVVVSSVIKQNTTDQVTLTSSGCHSDIGTNVVFPGNAVSQGEVGPNAISSVSVPVMTPVASTQTQMLPGLNNIQQGINPQAMMNLFQNIGFGQIQNNPGFSAIPNAPSISTYQNNPIMMSGNLPNSIGQENIHCLQLQNTGIPANFGLNGISGNQFQQYVGGSNGLAGIGVDTSGFSTNFGKSGQLMQLIPGESPSGCVQIKTAMATPSCDISQPVNKVTLPYTEQVMPSVTTSPSGQVLLVPNLQMPLLQVLGSSPVNVNGNLDKAGIPQFGIQNNDIQTLIGQLQTSLSQIGTPLNMMNVQQVWNNLTTGSNLTAMQLQTLQLQQQLLQQIQQLQGMQTLISQFNMQSQGSNAITTVANKDNVVMTAGSHMTIPVTSNSSEVKQDENSLSMVTMVNDVSTTTESPPNNLLNDNDCYSEQEDDISDNVPVENVNGTETLTSLDSVKINSCTVSEQKHPVSEVVNSCSDMDDSKTESAKTNSNCNDIDEGKHIAHHSQNLDPEIKMSEKCIGNIHTFKESKTSVSVLSSGKESETLSSPESKSGAVENMCIDNNLLSSGNMHEMHSVTSESIEDEELSSDRQVYSSSVLGADSAQNVVIDLSTKSATATPSSSCSYVVADHDRQSPFEEGTNRVSSSVQITEVKRFDISKTTGYSNTGSSEVKVSDGSNSSPACKSEKDAGFVTSLVAGSIGSLKRPLEDVDVCHHDEEIQNSIEEPTSNTTIMFCEGDLIWGQIRGFPSWPGRVVPPSEVIDPEPLENGKMWIKWYGDHTFTQVEHDKLKTLAEGLQAHQRSKKKNRKGRKMNSNLEAAIQEALSDLDHQAALDMERKLQSKSQTKLKSSKKKRLR